MRSKGSLSNLQTASRLLLYRGTDGDVRVHCDDEGTPHEFATVVAACQAGFCLQIAGIATEWRIAIPTLGASGATETDEQPSLPGSFSWGRETVMSRAAGE